MSLAIPVLIPAFPPAMKFSAAVEPEESGHAESLAARVVSVLVVDDERLIADSVAEILNEHGFKASAVYSGDAAISRTQELRPDIVMADVLMPRMNGIETAKAISKISPETRILLFSGQAATVDLLRQARSAGVEFDLLPKPIHPEELLRKIKRLAKRDSQAS